MSQQIHSIGLDADIVRKQLAKAIFPRIFEVAARKLADRIYQKQKDSETGNDSLPEPANLHEVWDNALVRFGYRRFANGLQDKIVAEDPSIFMAQVQTLVDEEAHTIVNACERIALQWASELVGQWSSPQGREFL